MYEPAVVISQIFHYFVFYNWNIELLESDMELSAQLLEWKVKRYLLYFYFISLLYFIFTCISIPLYLISLILYCHHLTFIWIYLIYFDFSDLFWFSWLFEFILNLFEFSDSFEFILIFLDFWLFEFILIFLIYFDFLDLFWFIPFFWFIFIFLILLIYLSKFLSRLFVWCCIIY